MGLIRTETDPLPAAVVRCGDLANPGLVANLIAGGRNLGARRYPTDDGRRLVRAFVDIGEKNADHVHIATVDRHGRPRTFGNPTEVLILALNVSPASMLAEDSHLLGEVSLIHQLRIISRFRAEVDDVALNHRAMRPHHRDSGGDADYVGRCHLSFG